MSTHCIFKRVIKSALLLMILVMLTNCNQFHSFSGSESDAHLSTNPVFENPDDAFVGLDPEDLPGGGDGDGDGGGDDVDVDVPDDDDDTPIGDDDTPDGDDDTPDGDDKPNDVIVDIPDSDDVDEPIPTDPPIIIPPPKPKPKPEKPSVVIDEPPVVPPPWQWCDRDKTRFRTRMGKNDYTRCRPCIKKGTRIFEDVKYTVCEVQQCPGRDQVVIFGPDVDKPSRVCRPCKKISKDGKRCIIVTDPPEEPPPRPRPETASFSSGDGGGDGGGDPLMIDSTGIQYANANQLRNSNASYFNSGELNLTKPEEGTKFNLLGNQHTAALDGGKFLHINESGKNFKFNVSWVQPHQQRYRFLALPDANGFIHGIDQLFGDNTYGPSEYSPFAKDGFTALMKYDRGDAAQKGNFSSDNYIDANDAVFAKLRLWHDLNGDGNVNSAEEIANELVTLESVGITYIHLYRNVQFYETDIYGNDIAYKSIVGFSSKTGAPKLGTAFDLYLQYEPREVFSAGGGIINKTKK